MSDKFPWVSRALQALRGDIEDWGDIIERCIKTRGLLLPEEYNEPAIRRYFEDCKPRCGEGDYWSYIFLCQYALGQYVYPQRKNVASFNPTYFGNGLSGLTPELLASWRTDLQAATIEQADALDVLNQLDDRHFVYLDPPYMSTGYRMYGEEFDGIEPHERLRDILHSARFRWALSYGNHEFIRDWYIGDFNVHRLAYKSRTVRSRTPRSFEWLFTNY